MDDHSVVREGLCATINRERDLTVCGAARDVAEAMDAVPKLQPDLVLADISLPGRSGLELIKDLRALYRRLPVLILSMHDESLYAERALRAGARGYITKEAPPAELLRAIRQVLTGHVYVSAQTSERILKWFSGDRTATPVSPVESLSDREFEILQLIGAGRAPKDIATQLHLSPKTVAVHNANIRQKLKLRTSGELIRFAVQWEDMRNLGTM